MTQILIKHTFSSTFYKSDEQHSWKVYWDYFHVATIVLVPVNGQDAVWYQYEIKFMVHSRSGVVPEIQNKISNAWGIFVKTNTLPNFKLAWT